MADLSSTQLVRVYIPDAKTQKCILLNTSDTVWAAKQIILDKVYKELSRDHLNYGLYLPPSGSGKLGKFMDDCLLLGSYALQGNLPKLEMRYKSRDYTKQVSLTEKTIVKVNNKTNQRKLVEYVQASSHKKIDKILGAGLDPNFLTEDGNTPLGLACGRGRSVQCIQSLLSGGAHIDFRGKDGLTPLHRAAIGGNALAINALLSYGASPNYRDNKGLTPVYHTAIMGDDTGACLTLLRIRAELGVKDQGGWSELHHTSKYGHVQHAELFIRYGADINEQNLVGNTPLHVAASHGQRECALMLLKRGADKAKTNFSGQTPSQVSILCGHHLLATEINDFSPQSVERITVAPEYSENARQFAPGVYGKSSTLSLARPSPEALVDTLAQEWDDEHEAKEGDLTPQAQARRKLSTGRRASISSHSSSLRGGLPDTESLNSVEISSTHSGSTGAPGTPGPSTPTLRPFQLQRERLYRAGPGKYVAVQDVEPQQQGDIALTKGMPVEVTYIGKGGYWEGKAGGVEGWFPRLAIKEVGEEQYDYTNESSSSVSPAPSESEDQVSTTTPSRRNSNIREVLISRSSRGYGFAMRGVRATKAMQFRPTPEVPALQYVGSVEESGAAADAGLNAGDFIIEVNGHNVTHSTHDEVVGIVRKASDSLRMKVITPLVKPKSVSRQIQEQITPVSTPERSRKEAPIPEESLLLDQSNKEAIITETSISRTDSPMLTGMDPSGWDSSQEEENSKPLEKYSPLISSSLAKGSLSIKSYSREVPPMLNSRSQTLPVLPTKDYPRLEEYASSTDEEEEEEEEDNMSAFALALRQSKEKLDRRSTPRERSGTLPNKGSPLLVRRVANDGSPLLIQEEILQASRARMERADSNQLKMTPISRETPNNLQRNPLIKAMSLKIDSMTFDSDSGGEGSPSPIKKAPPPIIKPKPQKKTPSGVKKALNPNPTDWRSHLRPASPLLHEKQAPPPSPPPTEFTSQEGEEFELPPPLPSTDHRPSSFVDVAPPAGFSLDGAEEGESSTDDFLPPPLPQTSPPPALSTGGSGVFIFPESLPTPPPASKTAPMTIPASQSMDSLPSPMPSPPTSEHMLDISGSVVPPPEFIDTKQWSPESNISDTPPPLPSESPPPLDLDLSSDSRDGINQTRSDQTLPQTRGDQTVIQTSHEGSTVNETFVADTTDSVDTPPPRPPLPDYIAPSPTLKRSRDLVDSSAVSEPPLVSQAPTDDYKSRDVVDWGLEEVCQWLRDINLEEHIDSFRDNEIVGEHLIDLSKDDLKELGVKKLGHQKTILSKLALLLK